ncbi:hypothetical protein BST97_06405 [Nonlabens spongiae]|uniref:SGNH/GDSL hydrolase family protein n=1 Tax=Nonlabens spongiae TaxID=331648 RepID=A0A1W6MJ73_9FLAO|nr:hypothetical protein [Nonlabens spongiae]ARN77655.1 hypothetical protein BST97_06405 [Nonlabens spongiae]
MKKFLIKCGIYLVALILISNLICFGLMFSLRNSSFYKPYFLTSNFQEGQVFDYVILGSSRGLTTLDSQQIDEELNTSGLNISMDDTDLKSHLLMLKHFAASGFRSKKVVLTLDQSNFIKIDSTLGNNDYRFAAYGYKDYVRTHYESYEEGTVKPLSRSGYLPMLSYSYYNLELIAPSLMAVAQPKKRNKFDGFGNYSYPTNRSIKKQEKIETVSARFSNPILDAIQKICQEQNMELIIYIAPYADREIVIGDNESNFKVINHSGILLNQEELFYDVIHVNKIGRQKATEYFIQELKLK